MPKYTSNTKAKYSTLSVAQAHRRWYRRKIGELDPIEYHTLQEEIERSGL